MSEVVGEYWPIILVAVAIGLLVGWWIFRPRQKVRLTDSAPLRPHMAATRRDGEGRGLADEAAAAASDVAGHFLGAHVHGHLPGAAVPPDDLLRLKGVGAKLAAMLNARGLMRFEQIARLSEADLTMLDASLGAFKGRLARDQVVAQAAYLARGDSDGFEQRFGKL